MHANTTRTSRTQHGGTFTKDPHLENDGFISAIQDYATAYAVAGGKDTRHTVVDTAASAADDGNMLYGVGGYTPDCLQRVNKPQHVLFWLTWFAFVQGFVINGINNVNTTTIERRFNLPASQVGLISSAYDISAGIVVLPATYFGSFSHQPRMLSLAALAISVGCVTMAVPHFVNGPYYAGSASVMHCLDKEVTNVTCDVEDTSDARFLPVFIVGQLLNGFGGALLYTIGIVYIDTQVSATDSPLYQGVMMGVSALGAAIGFLLGGYLLSIYVDFDSVSTDKVTITPDDPTWVGAWWVGFLASGAILLTVVVGMYPFPRITPAGDVVQKERISQAHQTGMEELNDRPGLFSSWKDIPYVLKSLLLNPVFMFNSIANIVESMLIGGLATFLPKVIQNQYGQSASWAALLTGFIAVPGTLVGNILGGAISKGFKLHIRGMLRLCLVLCAITMATGVVVLARCTVTDFAGVTRYYNGTGLDEATAVHLTSDCNSGCGCTSMTFDPVCGEDGVTYFTSCHAGCVNVEAEVFSNCSCVNNQPHTLKNGGTALQGKCAAPCDVVNVFLPVFAVLVLLTFMRAVPLTQVTLRCIHDNQRTFAMGLNAIMFRLLGALPGPILFGAVFDHACLVWQETPCHGRGSCWIYDNDELAVSFLGIILVIEVVSIMFYSLALCSYKPPPEGEASTANLSVWPAPCGDDTISFAGTITGVDNPQQVECDDVDCNSGMVESILTASISNSNGCAMQQIREFKFQI